MPGFIYYLMVLTSNVMMKSELDGMWKEMVMAPLRNYLSTHPSWGMEQKKPVRTDSVSGEIQL
jgi:hypothetical protein